MCDCLILVIMTAMLLLVLRGTLAWTPGDWVQSLKPGYLENGKVNSRLYSELRPHNFIFVVGSLYSGKNSNLTAGNMHL